MVYLIEAHQDVNLCELGDVVLEALENLNRDMRTDFRRIPGSCWPSLVKSTPDYDEYVVGRFEHGFNEEGRPDTFDSIMAYKLKSLREIFSKEFALSLLLNQGIKPSLVVIPGLSDTCPIERNRHALYRGATNEGRFNAYLIGKSILNLSRVDSVRYCHIPQIGQPEVIPVK